MDEKRTLLSKKQPLGRILQKSGQMGDRTAPKDTARGLAAALIGCEPAHIAKTMAFLLDNTPIAVVCAGDAKVQNAKYKAYFAKKAKMVPCSEVEMIIGHEPGGVCPFGVNEGVDVWLDESLRRFTTVFPACGSSNSSIELSLDELAECSEACGWADVCKDWQDNS